MPLELGFKIKAKDTSNSIPLPTSVVTTLHDIPQAHPKARQLPDLPDIIESFMKDGRHAYGRLTGGFSAVARNRTE